MPTARGPLLDWPLGSSEKHTRASAILLLTSSRSLRKPDNVPIFSATADMSALGTTYVV
jgi:hypothetical protein